MISKNVRYIYIYMFVRLYICAFVFVFTYIFTAMRAKILQPSLIYYDATNCLQTIHVHTIIMRPNTSVTVLIWLITWISD